MRVCPHICPHIRPHISKTHTAKKCKIKGQAVHLFLQANYSTFFNEEESTHDTLVLPFQLTSAGAFHQLASHPSDPARSNLLFIT